MNDENQFYWDELSPEARAIVKAEMARTGEDMETVINRLVLEQGRKEFPDE
jgi:hypothetical protein